MVSKVFSNDGQELRVYVNSNNLLFIHAGIEDDSEPYFQGFVTLDIDDAEELINELKQCVGLMKQLQNG